MGEWQAASHSQHGCVEVALVREQVCTHHWNVLQERGLCQAWEDVKRDEELSWPTGSSHPEEGEPQGEQGHRVWLGWGEWWQLQTTVEQGQKVRHYYSSRTSELNRQEYLHFTMVAGVPMWWGEPRLMQTKYQCLLCSCVAMPACLTPAANPELPVHLCRALAAIPGVPQAFLLTAT